MGLLEKDYFDSCMQRLHAKLDRIELKCTPTKEQDISVLPTGERLLDNFDMCKLLHVSKRTLQRYRSSGMLPYQMLYHKTYYKEEDVMRFVENNFQKTRNEGE